MSRGYKIYLCGGNYAQVDPRPDCPSPLHDWPLPAGYVDAGEVAGARLRARWSNPQCKQCGLYGWLPGRLTESAHAVKVGIPEREQNR